MLRKVRVWKSIAWKFELTKINYVWAHFLLCTKIFLHVLFFCDKIFYQFFSHQTIYNSLSLSTLPKNHIWAFVEYTHVEYEKVWLEWEHLAYLYHISWWALKNSLQCIVISPSSNCSFPNELSYNSYSFYWKVSYYLKPSKRGAHQHQLTTVLPHLHVRPVAGVDHVQPHYAKNWGRLELQVKQLAIWQRRK